MFTSDRFRRIVGKFKTASQDQRTDPFESTRRVIDLSDEIAALHKRIAERAKAGMPEDVADRLRLATLTEELRKKPSTNGGTVQQQA